MVTVKKVSTGCEYNTNHDRFFNPIYNGNLLPVLPSEREYCQKYYQVLIKILVKIHKSLKRICI